MMARVRTARVIAGLLVAVWLGIMVFFNRIPLLPRNSLTSSITPDWTSSDQQSPHIHVVETEPDLLETGQDPGPDRVSVTPSTVTSVVSLKATEVARIEVDGTAMLFQCDRSETDTSSSRPASPYHDLASNHFLPTPGTISPSYVVQPSSVRIHIGIVTAWWNFAARLVLREAYTHFRIPDTDIVTIRFVVGLPDASDPGVLRILLWERDRFQDLQILNVTENMNNGKSYEYFADLAKNFPSEDPTRRPWDYAMKLDDDSLVNLPRLLDRLRPMVPRTDLYMGRGEPGSYWHMGAGYTLSWDLVTWLGDNRDVADDYMLWPEDQAIGEILHVAGRGLNRINLGMQMMDHPADDLTDWTREFGEDVILVHRLKNVYLQGDAIEYYLGDGRSHTEQGRSNANHAT